MSNCAKITVAQAFQPVPAQVYACGSMAPPVPAVIMRRIHLIDPLVPKLCLGSSNAKKGYEHNP